MRITINGETKDVTEEMMDNILTECGFLNPNIATALNGTFVHKEARVDTRINEGDQIEVVSPIEGG